MKTGFHAEKHGIAHKNRGFHTETKTHFRRSINTLSYREAELSHEEIESFIQKSNGFYTEKFNRGFVTEAETKAFTEKKSFIQGHFLPYKDRISYKNRK